MELLEFMQSRGNARVNARYEANLPDGVKPVKSTADAERGQYIRAKYIGKAYEDASVELSPEFQEKTGSAPSRVSSLPSAPISPLVQAQRDTSPSRRAAPTPPSGVSPRRFADHQPPNLDFDPASMTMHRYNSQEFSAKLEGTPSAAGSSRRSSEVHLPGPRNPRRVSNSTMSSLPQVGKPLLPWLNTLKACLCLVGAREPSIGSDSRASCQ
jgi:hypothetical protein